MTESQSATPNPIGRNLAIYRVSSVLAGWAGDLRSGIAGPAGWRWVVKTMAASAGAAGLLMTFLALAFSFETEARRRNDDTYQRFLSDLSNPQERLRIAAISRVPDLLALRGPAPASVGTLSLIKRSVGIDEPQIYAAAVRSQVVQLLRTGPIDGQHLTARESNAILEALGRATPSVWFEDRALTDGIAGNLRWLWEHNNSRDVALVAFTREVLAGAHLTGVTFTDLDLSGAELEGLHCTDCRFERTNLRGARLGGAKLTRANFDYSVLNDADLNGATIVGSSLYATSLRGIRFNKARIRDSQFHQPDLGPSVETGDGADLRGVLVENTIFTDCAGARSASFASAEFRNAHFYNCDLSSSSFRGAVMANGGFHGSDLTDADLTDLTAPRISVENVRLNGASLIRANLAAVNFSGATGLASTDARMEVTSLNIANARGLSPAARLRLIQTGAVELSCDSTWQAYKRAGYPYERWITFRRC